MLHLMNVQAKAMALDEPADEGHQVPCVLLLARVHVHVFDGSVLEKRKALRALRRLESNFAGRLDRRLRRLEVHHGNRCNQKEARHRQHLHPC